MPQLPQAKDVLEDRPRRAALVRITGDHPGDDDREATDGRRSERRSMRRCAWRGTAAAAINRLSRWAHRDGPDEHGGALVLEPGDKFVHERQLQHVRSWFGWCGHANRQRRSTAGSEVAWQRRALAVPHDEAIVTEPVVRHEDLRCRPYPVPAVPQGHGYGDLEVRCDFLGDVRLFPFNAIRLGGPGLVRQPLARWRRPTLTGWPPRGRPPGPSPPSTRAG